MMLVDGVVRVVPPGPMLRYALVLERFWFGVAKGCGLAHRGDHLSQLFQIATGMIWMGIVARPEESVLADGVPGPEYRPLSR
jgi:hypothetical protein